MTTTEHILLIDDDESDNEFHEIVIRNSGINARVSTINDSRKALECWVKKSEMQELVLPDVVFLDVNMPALNGFELLDRLAELPDPLQRLRAMKVYILSTSEPEVYTEYMAKHKNLVRGFYTKPLTKEILREVAEH